jgi:hypothetical protein
VGGRARGEMDLRIFSASSSDNLMHLKWNLEISDCATELSGDMDSHSRRKEGVSQVMMLR